TVDNGRGVDRAANNAAGGVDAADLTELVQVSTFLESDHSVNITTNNLIGSLDADISELKAASTPLESEHDDYSAVDKTGSV
ncbi:putative protein phosphatase 2C 62-like, partial [Trifolium medium]|nr:putative protein phosphatase 2C 62-like [Trifolium medium]